MSTRAPTLALIVLLSLGPTFAATATDPGAPAIVRIKKDPVILVDAKGNEKQVKAADIPLPWQVKGANPDGSVNVDFQGGTYSIAPWFVQVKGLSTLAAPPDCLDNKDTRLAATRNAGEACKTK